MEKTISLSGSDLIVRGLLEKFTNLPNAPPDVEHERYQWLAQLSQSLQDLSEGMNDEVVDAIKEVANEPNAPDWDEAKTYLTSTSETVKKFSVAVQGLGDPKKNEDHESEEWKTVGRIKNDKLKDLSEGLEGLKDRAENPHQKEAFDVTIGLLQACCDSLGKVAEALAQVCEISLEPGRDRPKLKRSGITRKSRDLAISRRQSTS